MHKTAVLREGQNMMTLAKSMVVALGATAFAAAPAFAVTVANSFDKPVEVTADLGASEPKTTIEAGKSAQIDCAGGCELRVNTGNSYGLSVASGQSVVIGKDGILAYGGDQQASSDKGGKSKTKMD